MTERKSNKSQLLRNKKSEIDNKVLWVTLLQRQATVHNSTVNADTWYKDLTSTAQCVSQQILYVLIIIPYKCEGSVAEGCRCGGVFI